MINEDKTKVMKVSKVPGGAAMNVNCNEKTYYPTSTQIQIAVVSINRGWNM